MLTTAKPPAGISVSSTKRMQMPRNKGYPRISGYERVDNDFYVEPRWLVRLLLDVESFEGEVLDPCCGVGTIPAVCLDRGIPARGSDLVDRGFGETCDLFSITTPVDNIISNVPFRIAELCARHMLTLARRKVALILPMTFWESRERHSFFEEYPPARYRPCGDRPSMPPGRMDGDRDRWGAIMQPESRGGTMPYGWFIFEHGFTSKTTTIRLPLRTDVARGRVSRRSVALSP
jgi:hypothetical protein